MLHRDPLIEGSRAITNIVAIDRIHEDGLDVIRRHPRLRLNQYIEDGDRTRMRAALAHARGIVIGVSRLDREILAAAPDLEVVSRVGVGYDKIDLEYLTERGICLCLTGDTNSRSVAEHALYMLLTLAKYGRLYDEALRAGQWAVRHRYKSIELAGKTALVLGFGRIGRTVASLFHAIGMRILVNDEFLDRKAVIDFGYEPVDDFHSVLASIDVITVHVPLTPTTLGLIGASELAAMKPSAFVLNLARGGVVDEDALAAALAQRSVAGAGLDVFSTEPPPLEHPLLHAPNLVLSPHSSGLTAEGAARTAVAAAQNIVNFFEGHPTIERIVNPDVWFARISRRLAARRTDTCD